MTRYLITGVSYRDIKVFLQTHFSPNDSVAIGDFQQGVVVVTDEQAVLNKFEENGHRLVEIHDNVFMKMFLEDRGEMTGNRLAINYMNNISFSG